MFSLCVCVRGQKGDENPVDIFAIPKYVHELAPAFCIARVYPVVFLSNAN